MASLAQLNSWSTALDVLVWIASIIIFLAYFPGTWKIIKTKQTFFLSQSMWILALIALLCFVIYGGCLGGQMQVQDASSSQIAQGFAFVVFDGVSFILSAIVFTYKIHNKHVAKKLNMTEQQYCEMLEKDIKNKK